MFSASLLAAVEETSGKRLVDYFDLIAGTSTGGIIALGLGLGMTAAEIKSFYLKDGPTIFPITGIPDQCRGWIRPKHELGRLESCLRAVFGERKLGESRTRLVICSYDANRGDVHIFKTAHHRRLTADYRQLARVVALASAAAPAFFRAHISQVGQVFVDGGVWANCPAAVAINEAHIVLRQELADICVLSVGTTQAPYSLGRWKRVAGRLLWIKEASTLLQRAQQDAALATASLMLESGHLVRVSTTVRQGRFTLDDASPKTLKELEGLGVEEARQKMPIINSLFLTQKAQVFVPEYPATAAPIAEPG
jgi:patatin-like phospholipase/acyl hydrolase